MRNIGRRTPGDHNDVYVREPAFSILGKFNPGHFPGQRHVGDQGF
jgi:hypothetical protein